MRLHGYMNKGDVQSYRSYRGIKLMSNSNSISSCQERAVRCVVGVIDGVKVGVDYIRDLL